ncbi:barstar family protein [Streptomyces sp. NBC_01465]|uniref:barstar family protein n=1 Tax=Streptomyces sp. NBC_01465 TaxID=2903878 RepID=UPI002E2F6ABA|nr:barstar family protein [Streptomyces sp. NBC_01465]
MAHKFVIVSHDAVPDILGSAEIQNIPALTVSTKGRVDRQAFFAAVGESLPLDPPLESSRSWDALADSLWEGLHRMRVPRLILVWTDAGSAKAEHKQDFQHALWVLRDLAEELSDARSAVGEPTELSVYVAVDAEDEPITRRLLHHP